MMLFWIAGSLLVACTPLVTIEIQNTQRTNSEATRSPTNVDSDKQESNRVQDKDVKSEVKLNGDVVEK